MVAAILTLLFAAPSRAVHVEPFGAAPPGLHFQRPEPEWEPILDDLQLSPLARAPQEQQLLARMVLSQQLDRQQSLVRLRLGPSSWEVGIAGDAAFKRAYLTFTRDGQLRVAPLGNLNRLRGDGIEVQIEPGVVYRFSLSISWTNPVRGSMLNVRPVRGTKGPSHALGTGSLIDAVKARSFVFQADGEEYWTFYGTDIEAATGLPGGTRSLLFIRFDGLSSKAWPLAESALPEGRPTRATLLSPVTLTRDEQALSISR